MTCQGQATPKEWGDVQMVMVPKPGKETYLVKSWRPIVLMNTVGELAQKVTADELQACHGPFYDLQYASSSQVHPVYALLGVVEGAHDICEP